MISVVIVIMLFIYASMKGKIEHKLPDKKGWIISSIIMATISIGYGIYYINMKMNQVRAVEKIKEPDLFFASPQSMLPYFVLLFVGLFFSAMIIFSIQTKKAVTTTFIALSLFIFISLYNLGQSYMYYSYLKNDTFYINKPNQGNEKKYLLSDIEKISFDLYYVETSSRNKGKKDRNYGIDYTVHFRDGEMFEIISLESMAKFDKKIENKDLEIEKTISIDPKGLKIFENKYTNNEEVKKYFKEIIDK